MEDIKTITLTADPQYSGYIKLIVIVLLLVLFVVLLREHFMNLK